jgi:hypothetical protein
VFEHYIPVGTPWEYAPKEANYIGINPNKHCLFSEIGESIYSENRLLPTSFYWNNCPEHLKGKVLPRPEWAK